ncbi:MAG: hypothetical protein GXP08_04155 [Gammaproteobacteria bacterium]|nr:hypothetical protein [Gammaproteobacteria bacterium]
MEKHIRLLTIPLLLLFVVIGTVHAGKRGGGGGGGSAFYQVAPQVPVPESNPLTPEKIQLGRQLFRDRNLSDPSAGRTRVSCSTCHSGMMRLGFSDGRVRSTGVFGRQGKRNSPTVFDTAFLHSQFWDGRAKNLVDPISGEILPGTSLEAQALGPILDPLEMNNTPENVVRYVLRAYRSALLGAFPEIQQYLDTQYEVPIVYQAVGKAIASFERTVLSFNSPYDAYVAGNANALTTQQVQGLALFEGKGNCISCHAAPYFNDAVYTNADNTGFHNLGVFRQGFETDTNDANGGPLFPNTDLPEYEGYDLGRYYVTNDFADIGRFKTPTLRQLLCTSPYFHNGKYTSLRDAVEFVVRGTVANARDQFEGDFIGTIEPMIQSIRNQDWSEQEINNLTAFVRSLSGSCRSM